MMNTTPTQTPVIKRRFFELGQLLATPGGLLELHPEDRAQSLIRHCHCDWGDCGPEDWKQNDLAIDEGERIMSVYQDRHDVRFWIITESDRSVTTILLPSEY